MGTDFEKLSVAELFRIAVISLDEHETDQAIFRLHAIGSREVLEAAIALSKGEEAVERIIAAQILAQIGVPARTFPDECFQALKAMLPNEKDEDVISFVTNAMGFLNHQDIPAVLAPYANHPNPNIRDGVTHGLLGVLDSDQSVAILLELTKDSEEEIRNWATFGLGAQTYRDSPEIRAALFERLSDSHKDTRAEALYGLAMRKDPRALPLVLKALQSDSVGKLAIESAGALGDPQLLPALEELREWWADEELEEDILEEAIEACSNAPEIPC